MPEVFDILLEPDFDLMIKDGDFVIGESTNQHEQCILIAAPGNYIQYPGMGADVFSQFRNDESIEVIKKEIQRNMEADGLTISLLKVIDENNISLEASY